MGARHVLAALEQWPDLPDGPMRALVFMAATASDFDTDPKYWGGTPAIVRAMGGDPDTPAGLARGRAALQRLRDRGTIRIASSARPGRAAEYALMIRCERGVLSAHLTLPNGARSAHTMVRAVDHNGARSARTRSNEVRGSNSDSQISGPSSHRAPVADAPECDHGSPLGHCGICRRRDVDTYQRRRSITLV